MAALTHGFLLLVGFFLIFSGLGLAIFPRAFGWLAGPGEEARGNSDNPGTTRQVAFKQTLGQNAAHDVAMTDK